MQENGSGWKNEKMDDGRQAEPKGCPAHRGGDGQCYVSVMILLMNANGQATAEPNNSDFKQPGANGPRASANHQTKQMPADGPRARHPTISTLAAIMKIKYPVTKKIITKSIFSPCFSPVFVLYCKLVYRRRLATVVFWSLTINCN